MTAPPTGIGKLLDGLSGKVLQGKEEVLRLSIVALLSGGHILIEDVPGLGKTTIALALAAATGLSFGRVQCTSDLLPSDITGLSVYSRENGSFRFLAGPVFNNILLVDELNRAMPRTQSALLEAMEERRVTVEGVTHPLPDPFMVLATQNPSDQSGTFPLPESQLDRFLISTGVGYPPEHLEKEIISTGGIRERIGDLPIYVTADEIRAARHGVGEGMHLSSKVVDYIYSIINATRRHPLIRTGLSTRAAINLAHASRAAAFLAGRDFVAPDDVRSMVLAVCSHRLVMHPEHDSLDRSDVLRELMVGIPLPLV